MNELLVTLGGLIASLGNVQSAAVLREHLALLKTQIELREQRTADAEAKAAVLEVTVRELEMKLHGRERETEALRAQLQQLQEGEAIQGDRCPFCRQPQGELLRLVPHRIFGDLGLTVGHYKCAHCGKEYDKEHRP